jgi:hypothetical protein
MKTKVIATAAIILSAAGSVCAHRLDQYLQATLISVDTDRVQAFMRLIPGVAVSSAVLASVDKNADGILSKAEQQAYAEQVLRDVSISVDGQSLSPRLVSVEFPKVEEMRAGLGEIKIEFSADLPRGGANRKLIFENHHQSRMAAYLVNCLVPRDKDIRVTAQNRNELQSFYELEYTQAGGSMDAAPADSSSAGHGTQRTILGPVLFWFHGFAGMYRLGIRHIADGTDHLLFLLALLLPAPLLAAGSRWAGCAGVRQSLLRIVKVVTSFTVGHSLTLVFAALGFVHVPSRPIEVLIAVSILVSALHALRPVFPGREAAIAAFFGLIHGLAFATTLGDLGFGRWERVASIFGFNLGIETMQLIVVVASLPSLILLSRTCAYSTLRIGGALFAVFASLGWIAERLLGLRTSVDTVVNSVAQHALWIAAGLFLVSLLSWPLRRKEKSSPVQGVTSFAP